MAGPAVDTCPTCGAPLHLDTEGLCSYCQAKVYTVPSFAQERGLVGALLRGFALMGDDPATKRTIEKQNLAGYPEMLGGAVVAARARVDGTGMAANAGGDELRIYQPADMFVFNLAADLLYLLVEADNIPKTKRMAGRDLMKIIDANLGSHRAKSTIGQGPVPDGFEPLRAAIPHRRLIHR